MVHYECLPPDDCRVFILMPTFRNKNRPPQDLVTIYEAVNHTRKETHIGSTDMLINELIETHRRQSPETMRHWKEDDRVDYICLAYSISLAEAPAFIQKAEKEKAAKGWKVLSNKS